MAGEQEVVVVADLIAGRQILVEIVEAGGIAAELGAADLAPGRV